MPTEHNFPNSPHPSRNDLVKLWLDVQAYAAASNWAELNALFVVEIAKVSTLNIVAMLRYTYIYRDQIENWQPFLEKAVQELTNRQLDASKMLRGLFTKF